MRSIRHSLIVYFLLLLTVALGAVSWFSYSTTAEALRESQQKSEKMIVVQCEANCQKEESDLDRRLQRQAQTMAKMSRSIFVHTEGLLPFGAIGAAAMPLGYLNVPIWLSEGSHDKMWPYLFAKPPLRTHVESAEDLLAAPKQEHAQEYFQITRSNGYPMQRSASMEDLSFTLDKNMLDAPDLTESYDTVEIKPGVTVRRVTLKWSVPRSRTLWIHWPWRSDGRPITRTKVVPRFPPGMRFPGGLERPSGTIFVQYASDWAFTKAKILAFQKERDDDLAQLKSAVDNSLWQLGTNMLLIALATLAGIWAGGYALVHLGLAPLAKMSDAVSRISPRNFRLPLEADKLPQELQPIAQRLDEVLEQLRNAFAREKQASADISHELRTPLAALMTTLEVALRKTRTSAEYREVLDECQASGHHMYQLVERLLTLARLDAGADQYGPCQVDAVEVALGCADIIRPLARARGLDMRLHLPDPITLNTDPDKLREVLINLLHNAVEYNRDGGSIELSLERVNGHVRIEVRDTGIGIKPDTLEHIFERFYRADPSRHADTPHAGLGLAIVKSYIDLMGGTISVASSGTGTVFAVELPIVEPVPSLQTAFQSGAPA